jgi:N-acetylglucosaminyl-diphospho-decaprenol L-rhamnosyltransferase
MSLVDVVVVSYNSAAHLRACVEPLSRLDWANVIVVDNGSSDSSLSAVEDLRVRAIAQENVGFAGGCNTGWRAGESPYVLFVNPDAQISAESLRMLVNVLESQPELAIAAPRIVGDDGVLNYSLRRFPRLRSTYAQALYLHKLAPTARWADEIIRATDAYERQGLHEWVSGACMLVRRTVLEQLGGWDDRFFFYCEDIDFCRRVRELGLGIQYEPAAVVTHEGGGSALRSAMLPHLAASRLRYARLHRSRAGAFAERLGIALEAATHMLVARGGGPTRAGHARSLRVALLPNGRAA